MHFDNYFDNYFGPGLSIGTDQPTVNILGKTYQIDFINREFTMESPFTLPKEVIKLEASREVIFTVSSPKKDPYSCRKIEKIIVNGNATIVFWADKTKTVVKRAEGDKNDRKIALVYAIAKKKYGNISRVHKETDPFASTNAQRIAILRYIVAKDGFDIDKIMDDFVLDEYVKK